MIERLLHRLAARAAADSPATSGRWSPNTALMMWTDDPDEQELLDRIGMLGALPELGADGGFSVIVANAGQSKIDAFLERTTDVRIETAPDGTRELVADVTLRNGAPGEWAAAAT